MNPTLDLACDLIACPSETPSDAHCQQRIGARLQAIGFQLETLVSGPPGGEVTNLWAKRPAGGAAHASGTSKLLVFAGHTDVVPTGPVKLWDSDPFKPTLREGKLFGRGAADMKTSLAAFVVATEEFVAARPGSPLAIGFLLTSDEEGPAVDGTVKVCEMLQARGEVLDYCIVGEPTAVTHTGDMIKNGRRGSLGGKLTVKGTQGHIAYPQLANNPIHLLAPALAELITIEWDQGNAFFPPTSWQVSNIHGGAGASNVIPGEVVLDFNFRFSTESTPETLQNRLQAVLDRHDLAYDLAWTLSGLPFLTPPGTLVDAVVDAIHAETGLTPKLSTSGGTSDGRFIAKLCPQVIEFGPPNASIHKINEHIALSDIEPLKNIYRRTLENLHAQLLA
ncbi:succinyl-diaminopimelate desuccinylase [Rhodoferax sp.]|uniref:succinyl-diaminopimelate desuccinylase n=1 Tax=Rhodoferax sp. TaxID=50421 RepID=UPI0019E848C0|nr:succinyl-diaminopimelate desuccinylase [Rhodoferax sp.]MBE0473735.1 succinyl-diaminopimelate desuccinylase [Rhodoferax sp.]